MSSPVPANCRPTNFSAQVLPPIWGWQGWVRSQLPPHQVPSTNAIPKFVIVDIFAMFFVMLMGLARTEMAMVGCLTLMIAAQIITIDQALVGMSNSGVMTVAILFATAEGLAATGGLDYYMAKVLGRPKALGPALNLLNISTVLISALTNNTPQVMIMIPIVQRWAKLIGLPPSQLQLPMSFASILGGTLSLLGTSTNLVVASRATTTYCRNQGLFDIGLAGMPVAIAGCTYMLLFTHYWLPDMNEYERRVKAGTQVVRLAPPVSLITRVQRILTKKSNVSDTPSDGDSAVADGLDDPIEFVKGTGQSHDAGDYVLHARVPSTWPAGKTISDAGLRNVDNHFVVSVVRNRVAHTAVGGDFALAPHDVITFTSTSPSTFVEFAVAKGLSPIAVDGSSADNAVLGTATTASFRVVVREHSDLVGKTARDADFGTKYGAAIVAIHRAGERLVTIRLGNTPLKMGDVLVLVPSDAFDWSNPATRADLKPVMEHATSTSQLSLADSATVAAKTVDDGNGSFRLDTGAPSTAAQVIAGEAIRNATLDREFLVPKLVAGKSKLVLLNSFEGKTISQAGVNGVPGVYLVALERNGDVTRNPAPDTVLRVGDILWFAGNRDAATLLRRVPGLTDPVDDHVKRLQVPSRYRRIYEVVVAPSSDLIGHTVRESRFRQRFNGVIVGVHRVLLEGATTTPRASSLAPVKEDSGSQGSLDKARRQPLQHIHDVVIQPGDVLLVDAGPNFLLHRRDDPNFALVAPVEDSTPPNWAMFYIAATLFIAMVVVEVSASLGLVLLALLTTGLYLILGVVTAERAFNAIQWDIIVTVAAAFGMSTALERTQVAAIVGNAFAQLAIITNTGTPGLICAMLAVTMLFSSLIANNAAALLMFPIGAQAAFKLKADPVLIQYALMFGASDYMTSFGYQTNQMVMKPGQYVAMDYLRYGGPLMLWLLIVETLVLSTLDQWYATWAGFFLLFLAVSWWDLKFRARQGFYEAYTGGYTFTQLVKDTGASVAALVFRRGGRVGRDNSNEQDSGDVENGGQVQVKA